MLLVVSIIILAVLVPFYYDIFHSSELCRQYLSAKVFIIVLERFAIALVGLLIVAFIHQILITHKFCGPLVNFMNSFKKMSKGDLTRRIFLRRYDFLHDEAQQVNEMVDGLSDLLTKIKKENKLLISALNEVVDEDGPQEKDAISIKKATSHAQLCNELLSQFQLLERGQ
jgi:methyl-accepting chemotaxis protein